MEKQEEMKGRSCAAKRATSRERTRERPEEKESSDESSVWQQRDGWWCVRVMRTAINARQRTKVLMGVRQVFEGGEQTVWSVEQSCRAAHVET